MQKLPYYNNVETASKHQRLWAVREFKKLLRRRQRQRDKTIGYNEKNKGPARTFEIFVHFFTVLGQATTWIYQIEGFVENVSTWI